MDTVFHTGSFMTDNSQPPSRHSPAPARAAVRDVADFHLRWREFRPVARNLCRNPALSGEEADTLAWMIELMDRIGPQDVENGGA